MRGDHRRSSVVGRWSMEQMMEYGERLIEGKTKIVYAHPDDTQSRDHGAERRDQRW